MTIKHRTGKTGPVAMFRRIGGKNYQLYPTSRYPNKREAESAANNLRRQGYAARVVSSYDKYLVYFRSTK